MDWVLGSGEFGTVYLAQEVPRDLEIDEGDDSIQKMPPSDKNSIFIKNEK